MPRGRISPRKNSKRPWGKNRTKNPKWKWQKEHELDHVIARIMTPVSILASGMVTAVGLDAASSCAAIRCGIDGFSQTRFMDQGGEWIVGAEVPLGQPWCGSPKLVCMVAQAIRECLIDVGSVRLDQIPLLLCVAEKE